MKRVMTAAIFVGALMAASSIGLLAASQAAKGAAKTPTKAAMTASHATTGTVKSMTADTLVVTRPGKGGDLTFTLDSSTQKEGNLSVGSKVSVRYREEGKTMVATAVMAQGSPTKKK